MFHLKQMAMAAIYLPSGVPFWCIAISTLAQRTFEMYENITKTDTKLQSQLSRQSEKMI